MKINTKFNIKDKVYIKELKVWGTIKEIYITSNLEIQYSCRYFDALSAKEIYLYENEISKEKEEVKVGF